METIKNNSISILKDLIYLSSRGRQLFNSACNEINENHLREALKNFTDQLEESTAKLKSEVVRLGGDWKGFYNPQEHVTIDFNFTEDTSDLIHECEKTGDILVDKYFRAMNGKILWEVIPIISRQYFSLKFVYDQFRNMVRKESLRFQST